LNKESKSKGQKERKPTFTAGCIAHKVHSAQNMLRTGPDSMIRAVIERWLRGGRDGIQFTRWVVRGRQCGTRA
jgi:hypothetical protein